MKGEFKILANLGFIRHDLNTSLYSFNIGINSKLVCAIFSNFMNVHYSAIDKEIIAKTECFRNCYF